MNDDSCRHDTRSTGAAISSKASGVRITKHQIELACLDFATATVPCQSTFGPILRRGSRLDQGSTCPVTSVDLRTTGAVTGLLLLESVWRPFPHRAP